jgi:hypothetical protein
MGGVILANWRLAVPPPILFAAPYAPQEEPPHRTCGRPANEPDSEPQQGLGNRENGGKGEGNDQHANDADHGDRIPGQCLPQMCLSAAHDPTDAREKIAAKVIKKKSEPMAYCPVRAFAFLAQRTNHAKASPAVTKAPKTVAPYMGMNVPSDSGEPFKSVKPLAIVAIHAMPSRNLIHNNPRVVG